MAGFKQLCKLCTSGRAQQCLKSSGLTGAFEGGLGGIFAFDHDTWR